MFNFKAFHWLFVSCVYRKWLEIQDVYPCHMLIIHFKQFHKKSHFKCKGAFLFYVYVILLFLFISGKCCCYCCCCRCTTALLWMWVKSHFRQSNSAQMRKVKPHPLSQNRKAHHIMWRRVTKPTTASDMNAVQCPCWADDAHNLCCLLRLGTCDRLRAHGFPVLVDVQ